MKFMNCALPPLRLLAGAVLTTAAFVVLADPPPHAPAHGWRAKHDSYYVGYTGTRWPSDYEITSGHCNREEVGAVIGGVTGGIDRTRSCASRKTGWLRLSLARRSAH